MADKNISQLSAGTTLAGTEQLPMWQSSATVTTTPAAMKTYINPLTALGDLVYGGASGASTALSGNTTSTQKFLAQTGTGSVSAAPAWFDLFGTSNNWTGNQGFNTTTARRRVDILDATNPQLRLSQADNAQYVDLQATSSGYLYVVPSGGRTGFGISSPTAILQTSVTGTTYSRQMQWRDGSFGNGFVGIGSGVVYFGSDAGRDLAICTGSDMGTIGSATPSGESLRITSTGNVLIGTAALATNATDGFLYVDTCAGTPTGTPTSYTGRKPLVYDTTNNRLYVYNGAWKSVTLA